MNKKGYLIALIFVLILGSFFYFKNNNNNNKGLSKSQYEEITGKSVSDKEWREMTKDGDVEIIGGADGPTSIYVENSVK